MASMTRHLRRLPATRLAAFSTSGPPPPGSQPASWSVAAKVSAATLCTGSASLLWTWVSEQEKAEEEEQAASFDADHYKNGVNANFLSGSENDILATYGGPCGRFENPETRDIAKGKDAVLAALGRVFPLEGKDVADLGAGTGLFLAPLAEAVGPTGSVSLVELSPQFVSHLKKEVADGGFPASSTRVVQCTDRSAKLLPNSTDLAFICDVYHHLEYPKTFIGTVSESLRPAGMLLVIDFHRDDSKITSHPAGWVMAHVRADQATFRSEIEASGFDYVMDLDIPELNENYAMLFKKKK